MTKKYTRTNIYMINKKLWLWAIYKAKILGFKNISEYIFDLLNKEKEKE